MFENQSNFIAEVPLTNRAVYVILTKPNSHSA